MFKCSWFVRFVRSGVKKKLNENRIEGRNIGYTQQEALIRYFFHFEPKNIDEFAKAWCQIEWLASLDLLPVSQIPLKLDKR